MRFLLILSGLLFSLNVAYGQTAAGESIPQTRTDGEIYLDQSAADAAHNRTHGAPNGDDRYFGPNGTNVPFQFDNPRTHGTDSAIFQREIARWKDPLTLPHSRAECVKWASGHIPFDGDWKTCIGWKTQFQWMYVTAFLRVTTKSARDIGHEVDECFKDAAVAGAVSLFITDGAGAVATFQGVMQGCLTAKLTSDLLSVAVYTSSGWGDYE